MTRLRIAVLMGGPSPERDVSMATGQEIVAALDPHQYDVLPVEITRDGKWLPRPELVALPAESEGPSESTRGGRAVARSRSRGNSASRRGARGFRSVSLVRPEARSLAPVSFEHAVARE